MSERMLRRYSRPSADLEMEIRYILTTHGHEDHVGAAAAVQESTNRRLCSSRQRRLHVAGLS